MCRSIKKLRFDDRSPSDEELEAAALQFIRKISGYRAPSKKNAEAFDRAVAETARAAREMFDRLSAA